MGQNNFFFFFQINDNSFCCRICPNIDKEKNSQIEDQNSKCACTPSVNIRIKKKKTLKIAPSEHHHQ